MSDYPANGYGPGGWGPPPPQPGLSSTAKALLIVLATVVVLVLIAVVGLLAFRAGSPSTTAATGPATVTVTQSPAPSPSYSQQRDDNGGDSGSAGRTGAGTGDTGDDSSDSGGSGGSGGSGVGNNAFCRDLKAAGYSYPSAVAYWNRHGNPDRMDADKNGIPCETVYSADAVKRTFPNYSSDYDRNYYETPSGLLCRDLKARGFSYSEAVAYWYDEGTPNRMDEDKNGIPCETVYNSSTVQDYWN